MLDRLRRHTEGIFRGIGKTEAARIRGDGHIDGLRHVPVGRDAQFFQHIPDQLTAAAAVGHDKAFGGIAGVAGMVVETKLRLSGKALTAHGQQAFRCQIHSHQGKTVGLLGGQTLQTVGIPRGKLGIFPDVRLFAQTPQTETQGNGTARGIAIGSAVGQNEKIIPLFQPSGSFCRGSHVSSSCLGLSRLRSSSNILAP